WMLVALASLSIVSTGRAQDQKPPLPKGQMPDLGRPTKSEDAMPPFNFDDYFLGKWTFEWDVPEGPLGESGRITGTTVYSAIEAGKFYQADTEAKGPGGAFKIHELIAYHKEEKALSRHVVPSARRDRRRPRRHLQHLLRRLAVHVERQDDPHQARPAAAVAVQLQ